MTYTLIEVSSIPSDAVTSVIQTFASFPGQEDVQQALQRDPALPAFDEGLPVYYYVTGVLRPGQKMMYRIYLFQ